MRRVLLGLAVSLLSVCFTACGGGGQASVPVIEEGPKLASLKVQYGPWEKGFLAYSTTIRLPADAGRGIGHNAVKVLCSGRDGLKLKEGHSDHAAIKPGEATVLKVFPSDLGQTTRIVLEID